MQRGRPRKKPNVDTQAEIAEMVKRACELMVEPFDDRKERDDSLPSMHSVAEEMNITIIKLKKLLITGGYYSSAISRAVQERVANGMPMDQSCEEMNIRSASFYSNIPYSKGAYNLEEPSLYADQGVRYRKRKKAVSELADAMTDGTVEEQRTALWKAICAFQDYSFQTSGRGSLPGKRFKYSVSTPGGAGGRHYEGEQIPGFGNEMWITTSDGEKKKSISRSTVDRALEKVIEMAGAVKGPKALGLPGAGSYLFPVLVRLGLIRDDSSTEEA